jgi:hypothetical protein
MTVGSKAAESRVTVAMQSEAAFSPADGGGEGPPLGAAPLPPESRATARRTRRESLRTAELLDLVTLAAAHASSGEVVPMAAQRRPPVADNHVSSGRRTAR